MAVHIFLELGTLLKTFALAVVVLQVHLKSDSGRYLCKMVPKDPGFLVF